jgi:hypothetical protein
MTILISATDGAKILAQMTKGKVWNKNGENRVYVKDGYLLVAPETHDTAQVCYHVKSYSRDLVRPAVKAFNDLYAVSASVESGKIAVTIQEDEDGIIAPEGQHEPGVHIVREWVEYR